MEQSNSPVHEHGITVQQAAAEPETQLQALRQQTVTVVANYLKNPVVPQELGSNGLGKCVCVCVCGKLRRKLRGVRGGAV